MTTTPRANAPTATAAYAERLWSGPLGWTAVVIFGLFIGLALYPVNVTIAAVAGLLVLATGVVVAIVTAPRVAVSSGELRAADAHIPLTLLGAVRVLTAQETRVELGTGLDARAYVCLRAGAHTAVRVEVMDPADPTPYWLVSTRHPDELAAAITRGRATATGQD
ncbi:MAG: DUF3093 domain-containing protein [Cellulomonas sp.]